MSKSTTPCKRCGYPRSAHALTCSYAHLYPPIEERFWSHVHKTDSCWDWTGAQDGRGYGHINYQGRMQKAHRVAYMLTRSAVPSGLSVCHHCDNPLCVNPAHLFLGDHTTNARDMADKGRQGFQRNPARATRGEQHYCAKLTTEDIREIRQLHEQGDGLHALARRYGVSAQSIHRIVRRATWKHVT